MILAGAHVRRHCTCDLGYRADAVLRPHPRARPQVQPRRHILDCPRRSPAPDARRRRILPPAAAAAAAAADAEQISRTTAVRNGESAEEKIRMRRASAFFLPRVREGARLGVGLAVESPDAAAPPVVAAHLQSPLRDKPAPVSADSTVSARWILW